MPGNRTVGLAAAFVGLVIGIGSFTFVYAKGYSYLTNDPQACADCRRQRHAGSGSSTHALKLRHAAHR